MLGTRTRRTAIGVLLALGALSPGVADAAGWLKPTSLNLLATTAPTGLSVGVDSAGNTLLAWQAVGSGGHTVIQAAHHLAGPTVFAQLPNLSTDTTNDNDSPLVVTNRAGNGLAIWSHAIGGGDHQILVSPVTPGGTVGAPLPSVSTGGGTFSGLTAAVAANGDAVIAWLHNGNTAEAVTRQGLSGTFSSPAPLGPATSSPSVAIDAQGNALAVWAGATGIAIGRHPAGGTWTSTIAVVNAGGHTYSSPVIAANPGGQVIAAFLDAFSANTFVAAQTGTISGLAAASPITLSAAGVAHGPAATIDDAGDIAVGWSTTNEVQISQKPAGGTFPLPANAQSIPAPTNGSFALGGNGAGDVIVGWSLFDTTPGVMQNVVRAAVKPHGAAAFGAAQTISDTTTYSSSPVIGLDQAGDGVAGIQLGATPTGLAVAVYDAGPQITTPTGPAAVKQGVAAAFSVTQPTAAFSSVSDVRWTFGDGTASAAGLNVSHVFARTGTFAVKVTATDAAGNATSATTSVTVTSAAPQTTVTTATFGNQRITLTTPSLQSCTGKTGRLSVRLASSSIAKSKATKLRFVRAALYLDRGVRHTRRVTKHLRNGHKKRVTVVFFRPNATVRHLPATVALRVAGLRSGTHTLKVVLTYSKRVTRHRHRVTVTVSKTLKVKFRVC
jgi:PKD repeat protein